MSSEPRDLSKNMSANIYQSPKVDPLKQEMAEKEFPESPEEIESNILQAHFESKNIKTEVQKVPMRGDRSSPLSHSIEEPPFEENV